MVPKYSLPDVEPSSGMCILHVHYYFVSVHYLFWCIGVALMMAQDQTESTREPITYGSFINQFQQDSIKLIGQLERIYAKMWRQRMSILFNKICINEEILPKYNPLKREPM